ncbi:MAG: hypothetical protein IJ298_01790 [Ruminococcus sp.]|nr:hypothetical protein [Ruminococcus sp.]
MITKMLNNRTELQKFLFIRGFLITSKDIPDTNVFPFYGNWKKEKHGNYWYMAHNLTGMHIYEDNGTVFFIMGHAYNPFTMEHEEQAILRRIAQSYGTDSYISCLNELTGIFVAGVAKGNEIEFHVDASGMQSACYADIDNTLYVSSHPQLIGDLCNLQMDDFVKELISYKWYGRVMGPYLPCDMTPFSNVKRIVPSIMYKYNEGISHYRFWFNKPISTATTDEDYQKVIESAADILKNNMTLITKKWNNPWISLTGGIDSNTTFAAANGNYDCFETFSYVSAEKEVPDTEAAAKISEAFNIKHNIYNIPDNNEDIEDYDAIVAILNHNNGYVAEGKGNELRKRIHLHRNCNCDVEVKSWTSETIRGYWYKHYGRKTMPELSPKLFRNLYKIFITNRSLAHKIDKLFAEYIEKFEYKSIPSCYPPADIHYNEVTWGSWGGMNISEMKFCFDITIAYNSRRFLDLLFRVPLDKRISDQHHLDMKKYLNKELYDMNIRVVNLKETRFRAFALNVIFTINSFLPF